MSTGPVANDVTILIDGVFRRNGTHPDFGQHERGADTQQTVDRKPVSEQHEKDGISEHRAEDNRKAY